MKVDKMKLSTIVTAAVLCIASTHLCQGLSLAPRRTEPSAAFASFPSRSSPSHAVGSSTRTKLFSATAISADGSFSDGGARNSAEVFDVNYGPALKLGKLKVNLFGLVFGLWEIFWAVFYWFPALTLYSLLRKLPGNLMGKLDPYRRVPIAVGYGWALLSMTLFGMWPKVEGRENLEVLREFDENGKKGKLKPAMYVANHCSWMDIPFVGRVFGFSHYKMIAKAELLKVPILGKAIAMGGHVTLDRTNRKSQMQAYKSGVQWLKDGVNLVTFPEGTRSKNGRMSSFKMGAFKMAQAVGACVVPMAICHADVVQPVDYAFPARPSFRRPKAVIKIGKPISTEGKSDDELLKEVWSAIADNLPESQKPSKDTPVGVN